ncbi:MAG TPA: hypothetical protein VMT93_09120 [Gemmatimonadaceae bacterium]|nr:hypothetical protein [Gemmatimonadaceae bacterium]
MNRRILTTGIGAAAVAFVFAACSSDTTAPNSTSTQVAQASRSDAGQSAVQTLNELGANEAAATAAPNIVGTPAGGNPSATVSIVCTGPETGPGGGNGWYNCSAALENGLTVQRSIRFWEGTSLGLAWSPTLTDSVNHYWTVNGSFNPPADTGKTFTVHDTSAATMTVLRPEGSQPRHSWTGAGNRHESVDWSEQDGARNFTHTGRDTVAAVLFQMPRSSNPYPLSGSIIRNVNETFTGPNVTVSRTRRIVVTFNGSSTAQLQDGTVVCDLDLTTGNVSNCH